MSAKRIAAVIGGAALVATSLAVASPITISSMPIISNTGQPVVQIVVGSKAMPSDGVAAANIAAAIGNLAFKTVNVTASVNQSEAQKVLHVVSSSSSSAPSSANAQVYFNSTSTTSVAGTYSFSALIGSVLNRAVKLNVPQYTTSLQSGTNYAYPISSAITNSPPSSVFSSTASIYNTTPVASVNGGGANFQSGFRYSNSADNILRVTSSQLPSLLSSYGANLESEYLWVTGFPVYDQQTSPKIQNFALLSAGGAYQAVFGKPVSLNTSATAKNNVQIMLLGKPWVILNVTSLPSGTVESTNTVSGGSINLASTLTNTSTVYVGENLSSGPYKVELTGLGNQNASGIAQASVAVYYKNSTNPVNVSVVPSDKTTKFNISGTNLFLHIGNTFAGLRSSSEFAQMQLYSNVYKISNGTVFNNTNDKGWTADLLWTNTSSGGGVPNQLQSIIIYNDTPANLLPGQSFNFIRQPAMYKLVFDGATLGSSNSRQITFQTQQATQTYQNLGAAGGNLTEPAQELLVTSAIPSAFQYQGQQNSTVLFDLTPYTFQNTTAFPASNTPAVTEVKLSTTSTTVANMIAVHGLTLTVNGQPLTFTSAGTQNLATPVSVVKSIKLNTALPYVNVSVSSNTPGGTTFYHQAYLNSSAGGTPGVFYPPTTGSNPRIASVTNVIFLPDNQQFSISPNNPSGTSGNQEFFTAKFQEQAVATNNSAVDALGFQLYNKSSGGLSGTLFDLNRSIGGQYNNMTYFPVNSTADYPSETGFSVEPGFVTQRGSMVGTLSATSVSVGYAYAPNELEFTVEPYNSTSVTKVSKQYGPFSVGQAITGVPGVNSSVEIAAINNVSIVSGQGSIAGISNITATPSQLTADEPVLLSNLPSSPM
ncbi:MAG: S-layer protein, partial [Candidatus Marsarchaeota archaeon]|nr:S-layer protein [Candidatus Marsarchaeota archaeon]